MDATESERAPEGVLDLDSIAVRLPAPASLLIMTDAVHCRSDPTAHSMRSGHPRVPRPSLRHRPKTPW